MAVTWRECKHEEEDMVSLHDLGTVTALWNCGFLKFFCISSMRKQINLLQYFLNAWDPTNEVFQIIGKSIPLTVEDIYFLTVLSRHGAPLSLSGSARGVNLRGIIFADTLEKDLSQAGTTRLVFEMSQTGL